MGIVAILGLILFLVGWIWLMVIAGKTSGALWAVLIFFFSWLAGLIFCITKKTGWMQWGLMVIGLVVIVIGSSMAAASYTTITPIR